MYDCVECAQKFEITPADQLFYTKISVPPPTQCPTCRQQRRLAFRNELNLYRRDCDLCKKSMVAMFPSDSPYTVYCNNCWWSDAWDPISYGKPYDSTRSFFEQFSELEKSIPHFALFQDKNSENCEYTNYGLNNKSCYLALCFFSEEVYYSHSALQSKSSIDIHKCVMCELCYDCIDCTSCYNLFFSKNSTDCRDSYFLEDCIGCSDCFCSAGLRKRRFVFKNEQLSEEAYRERMKDISFTHETIREFKKDLTALSLRIPKKYMHGVSNEQVTGDYIDNCKNIIRCFDCLNECENLAYCDFCGLKCRDSLDCSYAGVGLELCYEMNGIATAYDCLSLYAARDTRTSSYSQCIYSSEYVFGCIGLNRKKYCILNKQYTEDEYHALRSRIVDQMKKDGEYGEFFPMRLSPFAYNESVASEYYPLSREQVLNKGLSWREPVKITFQDANTDTCTRCQNQFRLIPQEVQFYQTNRLPTPNLCHKCRHHARFQQRNPRQLWDRSCSKCDLALQTAYSPDRPEKIYCESCYSQEVF